MTLDAARNNGQGADNPAVTNAVRDALMRYTPLRIWGHGIQVKAREGTVFLSGMARSRTAKETAERIARETRGVTAVKNEIVVDGDVEIAVSQALAADPRTAGAFPGILVGVVFGVAYLKGTVASPQVKNAAGEIAGRVPGVRRVSNELIVPTAKPAAAPA